jgi:uncharacterized FAD-dependent dehydrogenase
MQAQVQNLSISIFETDLQQAAAKALRVKPDTLRDLRILRRSLDARKHADPQFIYSLAFTLPEGFSLPAQCQAKPYLPVELPEIQPMSLPDASPIVVGCGPAGIFAGLAFALAGLKPLLVDRGNEVDKRARDVNRFWTENLLDPESNMYFGEGGAGTFSDGKLTTRSKSPLMLLMLQEFVRAGAPETILFEAKPHLGTDVLIRMLPKLRSRLLELGASIRFNTRLNDLRRGHGNTLEVQLGDEWLPARPLVLAIGHSAFDTYRLLHSRQVALAAKGNAFGFRIEHPAEMITQRFYGRHARVQDVLGNAPYQVSAKVDKGKHSVYSFCCCPGGEVVACSARPESVSVNGMSNSQRNSPFTNSGMVTNVGEGEFAAGPLEALLWREEIEAKCYSLGGGGFTLPAQRVADFIAGRRSASLGDSSCRQSLISADLTKIYPTYLTERLQCGLQALERQVPGWIANGLLIGAETTTSAPLRILRDQQRESVNTPDLLPVGEGSGYAGGIMTSAFDGYQAAADWMHRQ